MPDDYKTMLMSHFSQTSQKLDRIDHRMDEQAVETARLVAQMEHATRFLDELSAVSREHQAAHAKIKEQLAAQQKTEGDHEGRIRRIERNQSRLAGAITAAAGSASALVNWLFGGN